MNHFLSTSIEINSPDYAVDIYNSSIRTLLGWPRLPPGVVEISDLPVGPQRGDYPDDKTFKDAHTTWLNNLPAVHSRLPEPKWGDFFTESVSDPPVEIKFLHDFSFFT